MRDENTSGPSSVLPCRQYLDRLDDIAFENPIDDVDAVEDLGEDGVLVIEPRVVDEIDEDLRVAGVAAARRDADRAAHVRPQADFVAHEAASPTYSLAPGLPPWMTKFGTTRWNVRPL